MTTLLEINDTRDWMPTSEDLEFAAANVFRSTASYIINNFDEENEYKTLSADEPTHSYYLGDGDADLAEVVWRMCHYQYNYCLNVGDTIRCEYDNLDFLMKVDSDHNVVIAMCTNEDDINEFNAKYVEYMHLCPTDATAL